MSFPLMPLASSARILTQAEVVDYIYNNYIDLCTGTGKDASGIYTARTVRAENASGERGSLGVFNTTITAPTGYVNGCTVLFFGARNSSSNATVTSPSVNGTAVSLGLVYNAQGNTNVSTGYVGLYYGWVALQPNQITTAQANFPAGSGTNYFTGGCIFILAGKWFPISTTVGLASQTVNVAVNANELVTYSCYNSTDSGSNNITQTSGTLIASAKQNWYDGTQHGLVYSPTATTITTDPTATASGCFLRCTRWQPATF
jgi:hypothetical protein